LYRMQRSPNEWFVQKSRQVLQERAVADKELYLKLNRYLINDESFLTKPKAQDHLLLRMLWASYVSGIGPEDIQFSINDEHYRSWVVQLLVDQAPPPQKRIEEFIRLSKTEASGLVLTHLASASRKLNTPARFQMAKALAAHAEFANDRVFPLMVWYAIEPVILQDIARSVELAEVSRLPVVRRLIARRFFQEIQLNPKPAEEISKLLQTPNHSEEFQVELLTGMREGLAGMKWVDIPWAWNPEGVRSSFNRAKFLALTIDAVFGATFSQSNLKTLVQRPDFPYRREAIETLVQVRAENMGPILEPYLTDPELSELAIRSLGTLGEKRTPDLLLNRYNNLPAKSKIEAINILAARPNYAADLLEAVQRGVIRRQEINAAQLRELRAHVDLKSKIATIWPQLDESPGGKKKLFEKYKTLLTSERLKQADALKGRAIFQQACATCHTLYGEGAKIGPELTGSDRGNLDYLLDNIIDPSGVVPESYRVTNLTLKDDRSLTGVVLGETETTLTFQTISEKVTLQKSEIDKRQASALSMMPEGLLESLTDDQVLQLFAYLMSPAQPK
jgi:putative heme-binding domain-containing protein